MGRIWLLVTGAVGPRYMYVFHKQKDSSTRGFSIILVFLSVNDGLVDLYEARS